MKRDNRATRARRGAGQAILRATQEAVRVRQPLELAALLNSRRKSLREAGRGLELADGRLQSAHDVRCLALCGTRLKAIPALAEVLA